MLKNLLTFAISSCIAIALFLWLAPYVLSGRLDPLPDYSDLVSYEPTRPGGHMIPDKDLEVSSDRYGQPVRWITNSQGYRNDHDITTHPAPGTLRILIYGDSFVSGLRTGQEDTIGAVLERELSGRLGQAVEVVISGHNNPANAWYHWQTHGRHIHPHYVILGLTVGNDITSHNFGAGVIPTLNSLDDLIGLAPERARAGMQDPDVLIPKDGFLPTAERSSLAVFKANATRYVGHLAYQYANDVAPALWPEAGEPGHARAAGFFISLGLYYREPIPEIEALWSDFETLLPGFVAQTRYHGAIPLLVSFPSRIEALPRDWERLVDAIQLDASKFDLDKPWQRISRLCVENALPCLNTTAALAAGQEQGEVFMSLGDMHFSALGQEVSAIALADFIEPLLQAPRPDVPAADWLDQYRTTVTQWRASR